MYTLKCIHIIVLFVTDGGNNIDSFSPFIADQQFVILFTGTLCTSPRLHDITKAGAYFTVTDCKLLLN